MNKLVSVLLLLFFVQGCATPPPEQEPEETAKHEQEVKQDNRKNDDEYLYYFVSHSFSQADINAPQNDDNRETSGVQTEASGYGHQYMFNGEKSLILSEVVSKMAEQLLYNYPKKFHNENIALTSIVDLRDHAETNWLGQTITEQFFHELHIRKLRVIDYKLTGNIQVTEDGEFALSRDWTKLNKDVDVQRLLTGTMSRNEEGMLINVRIVNATTNVVETTSSAFIPQSMFVGGQYNYKSKRYISRNSQNVKKDKSQVLIVR